MDTGIDMSKKLTALDVNALTGQVTERELTDEEIAGLEAMEIQQSELIAQQNAKESARQSALAKLAALGLTQDEIDAL